jgi:hypothetical protein
VRRNLLVAGRDHLDAVARVVERVEHADVAMPADAEHVGDLVLDQILRDQLGTLHARHGDSPVVSGRGKTSQVVKRL